MPWQLLKNKHSFKFSTSANPLARHTSGGSRAYYVLPHLDYCSFAYCNIYKEQKKRLQKLLNAAIAFLKSVRGAWFNPVDCGINFQQNCVQTGISINSSCICITNYVIQALRIRVNILASLSYYYHFLDFWTHGCCYWGRDWPNYSNKQTLHNYIYSNDRWKFESF